MKPITRLFSLLLPFASAAGAVPPPQGADYVNGSATVASLDTDPAEALGRYLRVLAAQPDNVDALMGAGRAAVEVGDANAAIGFWGRADSLSPRNGRIKAGMASALVQAEQPAMALKLFDQAVSLGLPEARVAADRGLAYDLRGDPRAAQREYAIALKDRNDPEVVRRLALSQAIGGDRAAALVTLDPLLRVQDRAAWRARAFVLALTGAGSEAEAATRQLLTPAQAQALAPFLARLPALTPAQKALAVHFGEMPADPRRSMGPVYAGTPSPAPVAQAPSPRPTGATPPPLARTSSPARSTLASSSGGTTAGLNAAEAARVATAGRSTSTAAAARPTAPPPAAVAARPPAQREPARDSQPILTMNGGVPVDLRRTVAPPVIAFFRATPPAPATAVALALDAPILAPAEPTQSFDIAAAEPAPAPVRVHLAPAPREAAPEQAARGESAPAAEPPKRTEPRKPAPRSAPVKADATKDRVAATTKEEGVTVRRGSTSAKPDAKPVETAETKAAGKKGKSGDKLASAEAEKAAKSGKTAKFTKTADATAPKSAKNKKASGDEQDGRAKPDKLAEAKTKGGKTSKSASKGDDDAPSKSGKLAVKDKADTPKPAKGGAERVWVQVAGGANRDDMVKEWSKLKSAAPALYAGKTAHTTPLRATNRLLVGPFKTEDEAQSYVNKLAQAGRSAFTVTTKAGQAVDKLTTAAKK